MGKTSSVEKIHSFQTNRTSKYLMFPLKDWGNEFNKEFEKIILNIRKFGINDEKYYDTVDNNIFVLCEANYNLQDFLEFIKEHPAYVHDYKCGVNHMIVLSLPERYNGIVSLFMQGKYSEMYSKEDVDRLFPRKITIGGKEQLSSYYRILTKDITYIPIFQTLIKKEFNVRDESVPKADEITELDFPPKLEEEIFNYGINDT